MNSNNSMNEERFNGSAPGLQSVDTRQEENMARHEPVTTPKSVESNAFPWLKAEEIDELQSRWNSIQVEFVDEPRASVEQARALVAAALERIEQAFSDQRSVLDQLWINHEEISTEDLRIALQAYRSFLNSLLTH